MPTNLNYLDPRINPLARVGYNKLSRNAFIDGTMINRLRLKNLAVGLRIKGKSYWEISGKLGVARSTLNGWLKDVALTAVQRKVLHNKCLQGLKKARLVTANVHRETRLRNIETVKLEVGKKFKELNINREVLEVFWAGLYLGDGFKINGRVGLGNADPKIVLSFVQLIRHLYTVDNSKLRAQIFGRTDQDKEELIGYWSKLLDISAEQFHKTQIDQRTSKNPSRSGYHGVCAVSINNTNLQRQILALGEVMIKYVSIIDQGL